MDANNKYTPLDMILAISKLPNEQAQIDFMTAKDKVDLMTADFAKAMLEMPQASSIPGGQEVSPQLSSRATLFLDEIARGHSVSSAVLMSRESLSDALKRWSGEENPRMNKEPSFDAIVWTLTQVLENPDKQIAFLADKKKVPLDAKLAQRILDATNGTSDDNGNTLLLQSETGKFLQKVANGMSVADAYLDAGIGLKTTDTEERFNGRNAA
ncbi:MAG: hypothetical protein HOO67_05920 [Candidatus Peribacteraceae bacterium]|nr:hypothetical protein [Candidatus Peribacteraceae bacterium]